MENRLACCPVLMVRISFCSMFLPTNTVQTRHRASGADSTRYWHFVCIKKCLRYPVILQYQAIVFFIVTPLSF